MSALQALFIVLTGGLAGPSGASAASVAGAVVAIALAAAYLGFALPRLAPRQAAVLSTVIATVALATSWLLLASASLWWPVWPAVVAIAFGHLGQRLVRAPQRTAVKLPQRAAPKPPPPKPAATESKPPPRTTQSPDRAQLGRYRIDRQLGRGAM